MKFSQRTVDRLECIGLLVLMSFCNIFQSLRCMIVIDTTTIHLYLTVWLDKEEDEDVHSLRGGTENLPGSSATKRRSRQIFKSPPKKVIFMFFSYVCLKISDVVFSRCESMNHCKVTQFSCVYDLAPLCVASHS